MSLSATSDVAQSDIRCCTEQYQRLQRATLTKALNKSNQPNHQPKKRTDLRRFSRRSLSKVVCGKEKVMLLMMNGSGFAGSVTVASAHHNLRANGHATFPKRSGYRYAKGQVNLMETPRQTSGLSVSADFIFGTAVFDFGTAIFQIDTDAVSARQRPIPPTRWHPFRSKVTLSSPKGYLTFL